ncbi:unnamed protein product [Rotaria sp. Silwood1]|nr:unnamed protein product [Rotaria sp. Silwood1]
MTNNKTTNNTDSYEYEYESEEVLVPFAQVQFWTYVMFQIPSIICTLYLLYYLLFKRRLRRQLHNHVVIVLLFLCFIILVVDNSLYLDGWRIGHGNSFPSSSGACLLWWFIDYGFYGAISVFLVWASFERHILIFYRRRYLNTQRKIFYIHYFPLIIISIYLIGFYIGAILLPPCKNIFYYNSLACGSYPCYHDIPWINTWDYLLNGVVCNVLEAFFSSSLFVRIIWRKFYSTKRFNWKKYRKMTIQLLLISTLSLCINLPHSFIILIRQLKPQMSHFSIDAEPYFFYFTGYVILLLPFVCLGCLPELWPKIFFCNQQSRRMVGPMTISAGVGSGPLVRTNDS